MFFKDAAALQATLICACSWTFSPTVHLLAAGRRFSACRKRMTCACSWTFTPAGNLLAAERYFSADVLTEFRGSMQGREEGFRAAQKMR